MRVRLLHLWEIATTGYWFVPGLMTLLSVALALVTIWLDRNAEMTSHVSWTYTGGSDGAKTLLSTIAASTVTVAGVVFTVTIAALTQASTQFGPRLLRNFMKDRGNQIVLGTFISTFLYSLLVLRTIHGRITDGEEFVPQLSVTIAVILAGASTAVFIFFIHHVSSSLQAPEVIAAIGNDFKQALSRMTNDHVGSGCVLPKGQQPKSDAGGAPVLACDSGYVQAIDFETLTRVATETNSHIRLRCRPGDFVQQGVEIALIADAECPDGMADRILGTLLLGTHATPEQDPEYALRQMVEVAVRALSPGVNDPFTAVNCIDALSAAVCEVDSLGLPAPCRFDADGELRLTVPVTTFSSVAGTAFNQIRQNSKHSVAVQLRLLERIGDCLRIVRCPEHCKILFEHAELVFNSSKGSCFAASDLQDLQTRWTAIQAVLSVKHSRRCPGKEASASVARVC